ncbi:MAG: hypothetical protein LBP83_03340 [Dysgonamonadaceae bacterium]|jgi:hypothetical protein|nr:hypothetical protein [Dysgonamonadaceae bacterium]
MNNLLKTKSFNRILYLLSLLFVFSFQVRAQVTIGNLSNPQNGALLDLKEKEITNPDADTPNSSKGVLFPKVSLDSATSLKPLFPTTADIQKKTSKGMIVYNVNKNAVGLNTGLCVWTGEEWSSLVGGGSSSSAKLNIKCNGSIVVSGNYAKGNPLNPYLNIITFPVEVTQKGSYNIVAYSLPDNQYYFEAKGEFFNTGNFNVTLNGMGTPQESTPDRAGIPDSIKIFINGMEYDISKQCSQLKPLTLEINDTSPLYYLNCGHIDISNVQLKTTEASTNSYIIIQLQVPKEAEGAKYHIETNTVEDVKFEGSGYLVAGQQMVRLASNGETPKGSGIYNFYFITNSREAQTNNCSVEITITGRIIKVAIWSESGSAWDFSGQSDGVKRILQSKKLFGLGTEKNPPCPVSDIDITFNSANVFPATIPSDLDIAILSYNANPDGASAIALANFIKNGGVVIQCTEANRSLTLPDSIFGKGVITRNLSST